MSDGGRTFTIGREDAVRALNDEQFLSRFPMFRTLQAKTTVLRQSTGSGCSSCHKRRVAEDVLAAFLNLLSTLPHDEAVGIKEYFGADKMFYTLFDKNTGVYKPIVV